MSWGPTCWTQVALLHERTYAQPARQSKAARVHAMKPPKPAPQSHAHRVSYPEKRSRTKWQLHEIHAGCAAAIQQWLDQEWDPENKGEPAAVIPDRLYRLNFIDLLAADGTVADTLHTSIKDWYGHPWHDSVRDVSGWVHRCLAAILFPLPEGYTGPVAGSARREGVSKRNPMYIPLLLVNALCPFWPFDAQQPKPRHAGVYCDIPANLQGKAIRAYTTPPMQEVGKFLRQYTAVQAYVAKSPDQPCIIQWDHVLGKIHLELGFFTPEAQVEDFWWDFDLKSW